MKSRLPTIRRIPDNLWAEIVPILGEEKKHNSRGRPPVLFRKIMDGILYVLRTWCQWKQLPRYGSGSTCHRRFQQWVKQGVFEKLWVKQLGRYDEVRGVKWKWQSLDSSTVKAPLGDFSCPNPTDRGKLGTKRHILTDQRGTSLSATITTANTHDM